MKPLTEDKNPAKVTTMTTITTSDAARILNFDKNQYIAVESFIIGNKSCMSIIPYTVDTPIGKPDHVWLKMNTGTTNQITEGDIGKIELECDVMRLYDQMENSLIEFRIYKCYPVDMEEALRTVSTIPYEL